MRNQQMPVMPTMENDNRNVSFSRKFNSYSGFGMPSVGSRCWALKNNRNVPSHVKCYLESASPGWQSWPAESYYSYH